MIYKSKKEYFKKWSYYWFYDFIRPFVLGNCLQNRVPSNVIFNIVKNPLFRREFLTDVFFMDKVWLYEREVYYRRMATIQAPQVMNREMDLNYFISCEYPLDYTLNELCKLEFYEQVIMEINDWEIVPISPKDLHQVIKLTNNNTITFDTILEYPKFFNCSLLGNHPAISLQRILDNNNLFHDIDMRYLSKNYRLLFSDIINNPLIYNKKWDANGLAQNMFTKQMFQYFRYLEAVEEQLSFLIIPDVKDIIFSYFY